MLKTIFLCILFIPQIVFSQVKHDYTYHHNDTLPASYNLHASEIQENIYSGIPEKLKKDIFTYMTYIYAAQTANETCNMINNGFVLTRSMHLLRKTTLGDTEASQIYQRIAIQKGKRSRGC